MSVRVLDHEIRELDIRLRIPFRYGIATMTRMPYLFLQLTVETEGHVTRGLAADCLPAKWFTKDPARAIEHEVAEMRRVIAHAAEAAHGVTGATVFAVWREVHTRQSEWGARAGLPPLLAHFGTSLVERAMIEAVCRAAGQPFHAMLRTGRLGMQLGDLHEELRGSEPADWLPPTPLPRVSARHTIGLADPLTEMEIPPGDQLSDGLPQSLEACIARYGLREFKVKVTGQLDADIDRTRRIAATIAPGSSGQFAFSLDGNEAFKTITEFQDYWRRLTGERTLREFFSRLLFVEQPLHRSVALAPEVGPALAAWADAPPLIIDESDGELDSAARALALGYAGTSHKNCKGVFKGVANRCLIEHRRRAQPARPYVMSGEDLCGVGPVAVVQDLAVQAALGNASVERNGHHYVAGLSPFPEPMREAMMAAHPDLYERAPAGWPTVRLRAGEIDLTSVNAAPLGVAPALPLESIPPMG